VTMHTFENTDSKFLWTTFGPTLVDRFMRTSLQFCWLSLPDKQKTIDELEKCFRAELANALVEYQKGYTFPSPSEIESDSFGKLV